MITHFLSPDFSLANLPSSVSPSHRDNFEDVLRQRDVAEDARQDALDLERALGSKPRGADKRRLQDAWLWHHDECERYDAMVQDAMDQLNDAYPFDFGAS